MIYEKIFYFLAILLLLIYFIVVYIKLSKKKVIFSIVLQTIAFTILILSYTQNMVVNNYTQAYVFIFGIIIPIIYYIIRKYDIKLKETSFLFIADFYYFMKNFEKAQYYYKKVISDYKYSYRAYKKLGYAFLKLGELRQAFDAFASAVDIKKDDYKSYFNISVLLRDLGRKDESIQMLKILTKKSRIPEL